MNKSFYKLLIIMLILISNILIFNNALHALTIKDASIEELTIESDIIVKGKVLSVQCVWDNESLKKINTVIKLKVDQYFKGSGEKEIQVVQMGGKIENTEDIIFGTPKFTVNDEVILFLINNNGKLEIHSIALGNFKIRINKEQQKIVVNDLRNVNLISAESNIKKESERKYKQYLLTEFIKEIKSINN